MSSYTGAGGAGLVYSDTSNVTWTKDANLLGTLESTLGFDNVVNAIVAASPSVSASDFYANGRTNWFGAQVFTHYLNSINYGGSNQWRLPDVGSNPQIGYNQTGSELGQLYFTDLDKLAYPGTNGSYGILGDATVGKSGSAGPFTNAQTYVYWSGTEYASNPNRVWYFDTSNSYQNYIPNNIQLYSWAVSSGQLRGTGTRFGLVDVIGLGCFDGPNASRTRWVIGPFE